MRFTGLVSGIAFVAFTASSLAIPSVGAAAAAADTSAEAQASLTALRSSATVPTHEALRTEGSASAPLRTEASQTLADLIGDSSWAEGDITVAGIDAAGSGLVTVVVGVVSYDSPFSLSWLYGMTGPVWSLDTDDDLVGDYSVAMVNAGGVVVAGVVPAGSSSVVCAATPSWDAVNGFYGATFPASCIGHPPRISWQASFLYEEYFSGVQSFDAAPFPGWAGPVVNDAALPVPPPPIPQISGYRPVFPARLLETRSGLATVDSRYNGWGSVLPASTTRVEVAGRGGVPWTASAMVLNVTAVSPREGGYLSVFPCGSAQPNTSSVNFSAGQTVPNAVISKVGVNGDVCIYSSAAADLVVDVNGYFEGANAYDPIDPARLLESRPGLRTIDGQFNGIGARTAGSTLELVVAGRGGVAVNASAAVLNVTAVDAREAGFLTVYPCGSQQPNASSVNFVAGQTVANAVVTKVGVAGKVCIYTQATTDLVVDVNGWFSSSSSLSSLVPARLLESRSGLATVDGVDNAVGLRDRGTVTSLPVIGRGGVPPNATSVVLNVTVTGPFGPGFVTVFPCGSAPPNASSLNFTTGQTVPNAVVSQVGAGGRVCIYTQAATHLIIDVSGYFL